MKHLLAKTNSKISLIVLSCLFLQPAVGFANSHSFGLPENEIVGTVHQSTWERWSDVRGTIESVHSRGNYEGIDGAFKLVGALDFIRLYGLVPTSTFTDSDLVGLYVACQKVNSDQLDEPTDTTLNLMCKSERDGVVYDIGQRLVEQGKAVDVCRQFVLTFEDCIKLFTPIIFGK